MQHQIADRVLVFGIARPDLLGRQPRQAILDAAVQLFQLVGRELEKYFVRRSQHFFRPILENRFHLRRELVGQRADQFTGKVKSILENWSEEVL